jgi:hypothetical protein
MGSIAADIVPNKQLPEWQAEAVRALQDFDPEIVAATVKWLATQKFSHPRLMPKLALLLSEHRTTVQANAATALGKLGQAAAPYARDIAELQSSSWRHR